MPAKRLPSGGPLKLDPALAKLFISHIDVICQPFGTMRQKKATALRDKLRGQLDSSQRNWGRLIADELAHTLRGNKDPIPSRLWDV